MIITTSLHKLWCVTHKILCLGLVVFFILNTYLLNAYASPVQVIHTCTLPYTALIKPNISQVIAKSYAYTEAINQVEKDLKNNRAVSLGLDASLHKALAAELYTFEMYTEPQTFNAPAGEVRASIDVSLLHSNLDKSIGSLLTKHELLALRLELLNLLEKYAYEGHLNILIYTGVKPNIDKLSQKNLLDKLLNISKNLQALWLFDEVLDYFNENWKNTSEVQQLLLKAIEIAPNLSVLWATLGEIQLQIDQPQNALQSLDKALNIQSDRARAYYIRGLGHLRLQQPALAKIDFDTALAHKPNMGTWLQARGAANLILEDYQDMCADFEQACSLGQCDGLKHARQRELCLPN